MATTEYFDGCEWDPVRNDLARDSDEHYRTTLATLIVGADGYIRLCASCAALPVFKRRRVRKAIVRAGGGS